MTKEENKIVLKFKEVKELADEVEKDGHQAFLVKRKVVKVEKGQWTVMSYEGLKGQEAVYGYRYQSDTPYVFWNDILQQVDFFIRRREEKQKEENASLEEAALK